MGCDNQVLTLSRRVWTKRSDANALFVPFYEGNALTHRRLRVDYNVQEDQAIQVRRAIRYSNDGGKTWADLTEFGAGYTTSDGWNHDTGFHKIDDDYQMFQLGLNCRNDDAITTLNAARVDMIVALSPEEADHAALDNLDWTSSGHAGSNDQIAAFDGSGDATELSWSAGTDNQVVRMDGTAGVQAASLTVDDSGNIDLAAGADITWASGTDRQIVSSAADLHLYAQGSDGDLRLYCADDMELHSNFGGNASGNGHLRFFDNATEYARWNVGARGVSIAGADSSDGVGDPAACLYCTDDVSSGSTNSYVAQFMCEGIGLSKTVLRVGFIDDTSLGANDVFAEWYRKASGIGSVASDGSGGVAYNTSCDAETKSNIRDADGDTLADAALDIRLREFERSGATGLDPVAQELFDVFPQAVSDPADKQAANSRHVVTWTTSHPRTVGDQPAPPLVEDHRRVMSAAEASLLVATLQADPSTVSAEHHQIGPDDAEYVYLQLDRSRLVLPVVALCQRQQAQIDALTARLDALES